MSSDRDGALLAVLERARGHGSLGPGPVTDHLEHARGFAAAAIGALGRLPTTVVDLGTGGGVPGLVLAWDWPRARIELVDANARRGDHLRQAITDLGVEGRVRVHTARAEIVAHDPALRESAELVTARSFGPPALTAEVGAGFVAIGGLLVVSEPPGGDVGRWPASALELLGFGPPQLVTAGGRSYAAIRKTVGTATAVPRSTKQLAKRPAW